MHPILFATSHRLPSGDTVHFRTLAAADAPALGRYFADLSGDTRQRFGPHPLDQATADQLCATIDPSRALRLVATTQADPPVIIAYFILLLGVTDGERDRYEQAGLRLDPHRTATLAPSVADAYQNQRLGSPLLQHTIDVARRLGRTRLILLGGTQATNERAVHFYHKHGFHTVQAFEYPAGCLNYDMLLDL